MSNTHHAYFRIADITIRVTADLPITARTFGPRFASFRVEAPGDDLVTLHHQFGLPGDAPRGTARYRETPWTVYEDDTRYTYVQGTTDGERDVIARVAHFHKDYGHGDIYHADDGRFVAGDNESLTLFPTDQILVSQWLAPRQACYLHAAGMRIHGHGLVFLGRSGAGKSTMMRMLKGQGDILCDDRVIARRHADGFRVHGTWSHGDIPTVSSASAPLRAILLLEKSPNNRLIPVTGRKEIMRMLGTLVVRGIITKAWWEHTLSVLDRLACEIPVYRLQCDRSGAVVDTLRPLYEA